MIFLNKIPIVNHSLDGICGVAILSVLLFHIYSQYFYYGYLGVNLFFILSGYLITNIIYTKLNQNNFIFKEFYRNRIRRIFSAVIIVFLFPSELKNLGNHIKSSAFFYQNFRLIDEVGYWDKAAQLKLLLHFWLFVEEQFYIFWTFIIYSLFSLFIISFSIKYFVNKDNYNQKKEFFKVIINIFNYFNKQKKYKFYYLLENSELGFDSKNCMIRLFKIFKKTCRLELNYCLKRAGEYRKIIYKLFQQYKNINLLDLKNLYCDDKYCYAIKNNQMLYADDDHHSVDDSIMQAKYFENEFFNIKKVFK